GWHPPALSTAYSVLAVPPVLAAFRLGQRLYDTTLGLPQDPVRAVYLEWQSVFSCRSSPLTSSSSAVDRQCAGKAAACVILPPVWRYPFSQDSLAPSTSSNTS